MVEARNEQGDLLLLMRGADRQAHLELLADLGEARANPGEIGAVAGGVEGDPHEEIARLHVVELLGVENVEAAFKQGRRDRGDNARPVGAGKRENVARHGHESFRPWIGPLC